MRISHAALALGLGILGLATVLALTPAVQRWQGDVPLFEHYAGLTLSGYLGRTPFLTWYPPLSLIPLGLPLLAGTGPAYVLALAAEMALVASAGLLVVRRFGYALGAPAGAGALYAGLVLAATVIVAWRYDIVPSVITLGSVAALARRRWTLAGGLLGIAAGLKIYAIVLVPVFMLWAWRRSDRSDALRVAGGVGIAGAIALGAYLLFPGSSPLDLLEFTTARPLHVESLPGAIIALAASLDGRPVSLAYGFGSFNLDAAAAGSAIDVLRLAQPVALAGTLAVAGLAVWRDEASGRVLVVACAAMLIALIATNRVLSPQYLVWLLPFAALAHGCLRWLLVAAVALSAIVFPWLTSALIEGHPVPLMLVVARNGLLVAAWAVSMAALANPSMARKGVGGLIVARRHS